MEDIIKKFRLPEPIYITRPRMPDFNSFLPFLEDIWESGWLTNDGCFHQELERQLKKYLRVEHVILFVNGTIALLVALHALRINSGEVITTPFTFPASTHVLYWNNVRPVFCDIEEKTFNLDPHKMEQLIRPDTKAILAVHVFGNPCDIAAIQEIAGKHGLYVIYDAAHSFGVQIKGKSILEFGDISALSFHATKLFTTIEGGAVVCHSKIQQERIRFLRNFGIVDEETVIGPGINGKMNEIQACFGLLQLKTIEKEIAGRRKLAKIYRDRLDKIPGIRFLEDMPDVKHNYCYFPIVVDPDDYGLDRDELHEILKQCNIITRKYFYPLSSNYPCYSAFPSAHVDNLPVANRIAKKILCLPIYGQLPASCVETVCDIIKRLNANKTKKPS